MQTVKFYTLGCKVNQYDTQRIRERFINMGFKEIGNGDKADIYVINTCTVTCAADYKSRYLIRYAYRKNPKGQIIVTGCYVQLDSDKIAKIPGVTQIVKNKERIVELIDEQKGLPPQSVADSPIFLANNEPNKINDTGINSFSGHSRAFLKIQDGCDNSCSYCKVPLVRGNSRSRPYDTIIQEAERLVKNDFKEIVLTGICLGAYAKDFNSKISLVDVIEALEKIEGLLRIRLSSIEAGDVSLELMRKMAGSKKLCPHLHIPMQSGDDEVLKRMNRKYSRGDYLKLIQRIRAQIPEIAITTDIMVGFPGETEKNFHNTVKLVREVMPLRTHIFPYSPREGTAAYHLKDKVNPATIRQRIFYLKEIAQTSSMSYRNHFLNKSMEALIEGISKENPQFWQGYTHNYIKVRVASGLNLKNQLVCLRLKKVEQDSVLADLDS